MALVNVDDLEERQFGDRFRWALCHYVALDREADVYMKVSHGRRRSGRPTSYYVMAPKGCEPRWESDDTHARAFSLTAWDDAEAVATANARLVKWMAKGLVYDPTSYTWKKPALVDAYKG